MLVELREITRETVRAVCALTVADDQRGFVAENAVSIAQAHYEPGSLLRAIHVGGDPAGLLLTIERPEEGTLYLWRLMIDAQRQRRGVGRSAMELLLDRWRLLGVEEGLLCVVEENATAIAFYTALGFRLTEEWIEGERVMRVPLAGGAVSS